MASRVQMDLTGDDLNYFVERGFSRAPDDLNCLVKVEKHGWIDDKFKIEGRPFGWRATRVVRSRQTMRVFRNWVAPNCLDDPISCYVDAEVRGWRYEGERDVDTPK